MTPVGNFEFLMLHETHIQHEFLNGAMDSCFWDANEGADGHGSYFPDLYCLFVKIPP